MRVSTIARAAMWTLCGAAILPAFPAAAQVPPGHALTLSRDERTALQALETAARGTDRVAQDTALAAARAAAQSADARHALAHYQLEIARARQDRLLTAQAVDALIGSGATAEEMPSLLAAQATRAFFEGEYPQAERLLGRAVELDPSNPALIADHAQIKSAIGMALIRGGRRPEAQTQFQESVALLQRAIQLRQASGQAVSESWYKRGAALAADYGMAPLGVAFARGLVMAYPTPVNWRDALHVYRLANQPDPALDLDIRRLLRASEALSGERDFIEFAEALGRAELAGEEKAVLEEGISRGMLSATEPIVRQMTTANNRRATTERTGLARARTQALAAATGTAARTAGDSHFGFGQYAEAVELYRAALQKGGEDPNLVNTRLGAALALAGQRVEAEAAFRAVTGPRADLAAFWLVWLSRRPL
jgi:tetratricopeptide (TPR) repeat protein